MNGTNPEKSAAVLRSARSKALCDDCVAELAEITNRVAVNPIASAFELTSDYTREKAICGRCHSRKRVTKTRR